MTDELHPLVVGVDERGDFLLKVAAGEAVGVQEAWPRGVNLLVRQVALNAASSEGLVLVREAAVGNDREERPSG